MDISRFFFYGKCAGVHIIRVASHCVGVDCAGKESDAYIARLEKVVDKHVECAARQQIKASLACLGRTVSLLYMERKKNSPLSCDGVHI